MTPGALVRATREQHGLTQRQLALRAGTSQSAVARIEAGKEEVTWSRLRILMLVMGEEPVLEARALPGRYDAWDVLEQRALLPADRLANGIAFNHLGGELTAAGLRAREHAGRT